MSKNWTAAVAVAATGLISAGAFAQSASTVVSAASEAMGVDDLNSITYYGSGANYNLGQNNNANYPWPRVNVNDYRRTIDFTQPASLATGVTVAAPVTGGPAAPNPFAQNIRPANAPNMPPANATWAQQLEIWITPWGFLKGAAANNATARPGAIFGGRAQVVTWSSPMRSPSGQGYSLVGYIDADNLVRRVETSVENPIFGDMLVQVDYNDYRDNMGLKYPAQIVQRRGGHPTFDAQILGANANPANLQALMTPPPPPPPPPGGPPRAERRLLLPRPHRNGSRTASTASRAATSRLRWSSAITAWCSNRPARTKRARRRSSTRSNALFPNKPIRYGVLSHHHFDHTSGLPAVVAEGITIVTHETNKAFLENALSAPRTLAPDSMARSGRKP